MEKNISLTDSEAKVLEQVLQGDLSRLLLEIAHTDNRSMRDGLKDREGLLRGVLAKIHS